jgi:hypothetical protein
VATFGVLLIFASMGMGILGLIKRGYELLVVMSMALLLFLGFSFVVKGIIG